MAKKKNKGKHAQKNDRMHAAARTRNKADRQVAAGGAAMVDAAVTGAAVAAAHAAPQDDAKEGGQQHALNEQERYHRQLLIWGEGGQKRLADAHVAIVGDGPLAFYTALPLAALGVGHIRIIGNSRTRAGDHALDILLKEEYLVEGYAGALHTFNPQVTAFGIPCPLTTGLVDHFLDYADVIIDTTSLPEVKHRVLRHSFGCDVPALLASVGTDSAKLRIRTTGGRKDILPQDGMFRFEGQEQHPVIALMWGGLVAEEVKKIIMGTGDQPKKELNYVRTLPDRFTYPAAGVSQIPIERDAYRGKSAVVVGAGALGCIGEIALSHLGFGSVSYIDPQKYESTNVNRQVQAYDAIGREKALVLAEKHKKMDPQAQTAGFVRYVDKKNGINSLDEMIPTRPDVVFDFVDNLYARALLASYCVSKGIPIVSAATSHIAARVTSYSPGETSCIDHVLPGYYEQARMDEIRRRFSCADDPDPSVIVTNQVAAALAVLEATSLLHTEGVAPPYNGTLKYNAQLPFRLGTIELNEACNCHIHPENVPDMEIGTPDKETIKRALQQGHRMAMDFEAADKENGDATRQGQEAYR